MIEVIVGLRSWTSLCQRTFASHITESHLPSHIFGGLRSFILRSFIEAKIARCTISASTAAMLEHFFTFYRQRL